MYISVLLACMYVYCLCPKTTEDSVRFLGTGQKMVEFGTHVGVGSQTQSSSEQQVQMLSHLSSPKKFLKILYYYARECLVKCV